MFKSVFNSPVNISGLGNVISSAGLSTDNALVRFDGVTGKIIQNSVGILNDTGDLTGINSAIITSSLNLVALTANTALIANGSKNIISSSVTSTELAFLSGVTSAIQTQLNNKVTGPASATDNAICRYDGITGKLTQDSLLSIDDIGNISINADRLITASAFNSLGVGKNAFNLTGTGNFNTGLGTNAASALTTGHNNSILGADSGLLLDTGVENLFVGSQVGRYITTGNYNILVGYGAGNLLTISDSTNIIIGHEGIIGDNTVIRLGTNNIHLKNFQAGIRGITTDVADGLPVVVSSTGQLGTTTSLLTGPASATDNALTRYDGTTGKLVQDSLVILNDTGDLTGINSAIITSSLNLVALTSNTALIANGSKNIISSSVTSTELGYVSGVTSSIQTQINTLVVGPASATDNAIVRFDGTTGKLTQDSTWGVEDAISGYDFLSVGGSRMLTSHSTKFNVGCGLSAVNLGTSVGCIRNTAVGYLSLGNASTSARNTAVGYQAGFNVNTADNTLIGSSAGGTASLGTQNTCLGSSAGSGLSAGVVNNLFLGYNAGTAIVGTSNNICIGTVGVLADSGITRIGTSATHVKTFISGIRGITTDAADGLPVVISSTGQLGTGVSSVVIGPASATDNAIVRYDATTGKLIQDSAVTIDDTTGIINIATRRQITPIGSTNIGVGSNALNTAVSVVDNTAVGKNALAAVTSGDSNTCVGSECGDAITSSPQNCAIGWRALSTLTTGGGGNTALGGGAGFGLTTADGNTFVGYLAGQTLTSGSANICIGITSGSNLTTEGNNLCIANAGVVADSGVIRIGTAGTQTKNFQSGIRGITTDAADALPVLISSTGQLGTVSSSIRFKEDIAPFDSKIIYEMNPVSFRYIGRKKRQLGLIAEEVEKIYPEMCIYQDKELLSVDYSKLTILLLQEVQRLNKKIAK